MRKTQQKYCENVIAFEKADAHSDLEEALKTAYRNAKKETEENQKSVVIACGSLSYLGDDSDCGNMG